MGDDKRSFNEYFSEEFGFTLDDDVTEEQLNYLVIKLIVQKDTHEWHEIQLLNKELGRLNYHNLRLENRI